MVAQNQNIFYEFIAKASANRLNESNICIVVMFIL